MAGEGLLTGDILLPVLTAGTAATETEYDKAVIRPAEELVTGAILATLLIVYY